MPGWHGSTRKQTLPPDWQQRRRACLTRDPVCTCTGDCGRHDGPCTAPSTDADHIGDRLDHDQLAGKCSPCHDVRSARQGATARHQYRETRPAEKHPGLI